MRRVVFRYVVVRYREHGLSFLPSMWMVGAYSASADADGEEGFSIYSSKGKFVTGGLKVAVWVANGEEGRKVYLLGEVLDEACDDDWPRMFEVVWTGYSSR